MSRVFWEKLPGGRRGCQAIPAVLPVCSGNTSVALPKHPRSSPNANERKKGDKSELKRL